MSKMLAYSLLITRFLKVGANFTTLLQKKNTGAGRENKSYSFLPIAMLELHSLEQKKKSSVIELTLFTEKGREGEVSRSEGIRGIVTKVNPLCRQ